MTIAPASPVRRSGPARALAWLTAWLTAYVPIVRRHRPRVRLELGPWLPGWLLRLVLAVSVFALAAVVGGGRLAWGVLVVLAACVFVWPSGVAPGAAVIFLALLLATRPESPSPLLVAVVLAGLPAVLQFGALLGRTGPAARIEPSVLLVPVPRFLVVQAIVQPLALLGGWLAGQDVLAGPGWILLPILAVAGLGVISFVWLPRLQAPADAPLA